MMKTINIDENPEKSIGTTLWVLGLLLAVLGAAGIVLPGAMSFTIELFFGWLMITGGVLWGYYTYHLVSCNFSLCNKALIIQAFPAFIAGNSELSAFWKG